MFILTPNSTKKSSRAARRNIEGGVLVITIDREPKRFQLREVSPLLEKANDEALSVPMEVLTKKAYAR